jgi:hypothetical protein
MAKTGPKAATHCKECGVEFTESNRLRGKRRLCNDCLREYQRNYANSHRRMTRRIDAARRLNIRRKAFERYGGDCQMCHEWRPEFLTIDHEDGSGGEDRGGRPGGTHFYAKLEKMGWPDGPYRTLCMNCNHGSGRAALKAIRFSDKCDVCNSTFNSTNPDCDGCAKLNWRVYRRGIYDRLRNKVLTEGYGGKCVCCGLDDHESLTIDHVNGGGQKHLAEVGAGYMFYQWLKRQGYPRDGFRALCMNCNFSRGQFGYCPHEEEAALLRPSAASGHHLNAIPSVAK